MLGSECRDLHRLRYHQGQMLLSEDFRDQQSIGSQFHAWHNRALHKAFGVVNGFGGGLAVSLDSANNRVIVETGLAYDFFGRELILQRRASIPLPTEVVEMLLLIRHKDSRCFLTRGELSGACSPGSRRFVEEEPEFVWKPAKSATVRDGVPIARARPHSETDNTLELDSNFTAHQSRPLARPRIAQGVTIPGATAWEVWPISARANLPAAVASIQVRIDTSSAGFTSEDDQSQPAYFARLQGPLSKPEDRKEIEFGSIFISHIDEVSVNGFTFRFLITAFNSQNGMFKPVQDVRAFLQQQEAFVSWLGFELNQENDF